jgi:replication factor C subunit 2/4|eukprot:TRINITY_DN6793_c0_g1_i1.p1 TRINITY_DN6793_c0_g1~~TRINITY_DN6793_c0_g1_i1.p1  ORF type:complete len:338 (-),score=53.44 TRINITY_DN6793_c0_g1_i1:216-1229(-)
MPPGADASTTLPWVEKYRPARIDEVAQQEEVCKALQSSLASGELPNLLFYGPPGTGKTTVALALVQQHFGKSWKERVKELNASDERGISAVREQVKTFAQLALGTASAELASSKARFRVVILDEADSMTHDAQAALRRIMEEFVHVTRFIIICNYVSKIIEPLHSRCSKFRFRPIDVEFQKSRILHVCEKESVKLGPNALNTLTTLSKGDMRCALTMLQTAVSFCGEVTEEALVEVACSVPPATISRLLQSTKVATSSDDMVELVRNFLHSGYSGQQVIDRLLPVLTNDSTLPDITKARCAVLFSMIDERLTKGCDEELQLFNLFSALRPLIQQKTR